jgi:serine/threonine-protein kinase haspin
VQNAVNLLQAKLADFKIDETKITKKAQAVSKQEDVYEVAGAGPCKSTANETPISTPESPGDTVPTQQPVLKATPIRKKKYQTMVEVRVTPRVIPKDPQVPPTLDSCKKSTRKIKTLRRPSSEYVSDEKATSYVRSILDQTLSPAAAQGIQRFDSWAARAGEMLEVVKLAEGSYGEVYKLRLREDIIQKEMSSSRLARLRACGDGVFKVVPLRAQSGPGSKKFTSIEEIVAEVKMLKYLDPIPGFARFREVHVVQGRFPEAFQKAWDHYKKTKDDCLNPNPSSKRAYPDSQIWAIIEMDDAGCELEKFSWSSIFQIYDIFWGVAMSLARAEEYALFEVMSQRQEDVRIISNWKQHRDLHLGNVCIRSTRPDGLMHPPSDSEIIRQAYSSGFGLSTLQTTLIDYSLSRAELVVDETSETLEVTSSDLDKKQIFDAIGQDEDDALLRDTYRQ